MVKSCGNCDNNDGRMCFLWHECFSPSRVYFHWKKKRTPVFYLIWSSATVYAKYRHATYKSAEIEIKRLHKLEPKKTFYILKAIAKLKKNKKASK